MNVEEVSAPFWNCPSCGDVPVGPIMIPGCLPRCQMCGGPVRVDLRKVDP